MSTSVLKALPGKLDIKRHEPGILYILASFAMSTSVLKDLPGKLDIKRHSPSILYISASPAMSTSVLKALPGKLDIKGHSPSILYNPWHRKEEAPEYRQRYTHNFKQEYCKSEKFSENFIFAKSVKDTFATLKIATRA